MDAQATAWIPRAFLNMPEPRHHNFRHRLFDLITIALFAVICGADGWVAVAAYGKAKRKWLESFLELPFGIPSHDTFGMLFSRLDPDAFESCFRAWMSTLVELSGGKLVAIDGKSIRRSFQRGWDKSGMAHLVSAFVESNRMVFAQEKTEGKGKELEAIEKLLGMLDLQGAVVTIDAIACNRNIAARILEAKADYILQVKGNQKTLHEAISRVMNEGQLEGFKAMRFDSDEQTDGDHGRIETRKLTVLWDVQLLGELAGDWPGLRSIVMIQRTREINGQNSHELSYYISSLDARRSARQFAGYIRGHWSIENKLHWQLDVSFAEDQRRIRKGHGAENFSRLCRIALNLLKREGSKKVGIAVKRQICGWDNDYLLKVALA
jgi:predicted transposase YbfD/YdcC